MFLNSVALSPNPPPPPPPPAIKNGENKLLQMLLAVGYLQGRII